MQRDKLETDAGTQIRNWCRDTQVFQLVARSHL